MYMGGTSASAPVLAALVARLNEDLLAVGQAPVGFLNPLLYHMAQLTPSAFNKVRPRSLPYAAFMSDDYSALSPASGFSGVASEGSNNMTAAHTCAYGFAGTQEGW